jgi:putative oxidoreductase
MIRSLARLQPTAVALIRLVLGLSMLVHGYQKLMPYGFHTAHPLAGAEAFCDHVLHLGLPRWLGYVSVATEFFGGILLILGLLTRFAAFMVAGNMLVALILVNARRGYSASEYSLALLVMALLLVTTGAGSMSLDRRNGLA